MTKIKLLFLFTITACIFSCSSDDDNASTQNNIDANIVSTWNMTALDYNGDSTTTVMGINTASSFTGVGQDIDFSITFTEAPNELMTDGSYAVELTTIAQGQSITQVVGSEAIGSSINNNGTATWSIDGDQLSIISNGEPQVNTITTLTENMLVFTYNNTVEIEQNGIVQSTTVRATYSFTR